MKLFGLPLMPKRTKVGQFKPGECFRGESGSIWMRMDVGDIASAMGVISDAACSTTNGDKIAAACLYGALPYATGQLRFLNCGTLIARELPNISLTPDASA